MVNEMADIAWWVVPVIATIISLLWVSPCFRFESGMGLYNILLLIPAGMVSGFIWVVAVVFK